MTNRKENLQRTCYKVVELSTVTDGTIEEVLNTYVNKGWLFDQVQFVVREASRRPSMAFVFFVRREEPDGSINGFSRDKHVPEDGEIAGK